MIFFFFPGNYFLLIRRQDCQSLGPGLTPFLNSWGWGIVEILGSSTSHRNCLDQPHHRKEARKLLRAGGTGGGVRYSKKWEEGRRGCYSSDVRERQGTRSWKKPRHARQSERET